MEFLNIDWLWWINLTIETYVLFMTLIWTIITVPIVVINVLWMTGATLATPTVRGLLTLVPRAIVSIVSNLALSIIIWIAMAPPYGWFKGAALKIVAAWLVNLRLRRGVKDGDVPGDLIVALVAILGNTEHIFTYREVGIRNPLYIDDISDIHMSWNHLLYVNK